MRSSLLLVVVLGAACSGKADSVTKVDGKKTLDTLTADDRKQLCTDLLAFGKKNRDPKAQQQLSCKMNAVFLAGAGEDAAGKKQACQASYDECMSEPLKDESPDLDADCKFLDELKCNVSIDEFVACLREQVVASKAIGAEISCDKIPDGDSTDYALEIMKKLSGEKCNAIKDRCGKLK